MLNMFKILVHHTSPKITIKLFGNTLQQMWHVLTFHEKRFKLLNQTINDLSKQNNALLQRITVLENAASEPKKTSETNKKSLKQQVELEISE